MKGVLKVKLKSLYLGIILFSSACSSVDPSSTNQSPKLEQQNSALVSLQESDSCTAFHIINKGPRGGNYISSDGSNFRYAIFNVEIGNDTIAPLHLTLNFPSTPCLLSPDSITELEVFMMPEEFTPTEAKDTFNFGVRIEEFFEANIKKEFLLETEIPPSQSHSAFIVLLFNTELKNGVTRTKLFTAGRDQEAPFYQDNSHENYSFSKPSAKLYFGISFDPPNHHALIPCGYLLLEAQ